MKNYLDFSITKQPDDTTCGPTCLHSIYQYFGDSIDLHTVIEETPKFKEGGTLAVFLACHALKRGYKAKIYTYNLEVFDPTWLTKKGTDIIKKLKAQMDNKTYPKFQTATKGYLEFLENGGELLLEDLRPALIRNYLKKGIPILTGLNATYLHRTMREFGHQGDDDDIRGESVGHFVVLHGYDKEKREVYVADPLYTNPLSTSHYYAAGIERVICSILLGILTYDANFLIIEPKTKDNKNVDLDRR